MILFRILLQIVDDLKYKSTARTVVSSSRSS